MQIDVSSRIKLTAFLVALRGMIEQTAPGMVAWESLTYHDQAYVKLTPTERAKKELPPGVKEPCLFYAILPNGLLLTLNQRLLEQAIDRQAARKKRRPTANRLQRRRIRGSAAANVCNSTKRR